MNGKRAFVMTRQRTWMLTAISVALFVLLSWIFADGLFSAPLWNGEDWVSSPLITYLLIGVIVLARNTVRPFKEKEIELVTTFADQAVIAIENVRLFDEVQARTRELGKALEQQVATGEILRVIASSPTDITPVLNAVAESAARLCGAVDAQIFRAEGDVLRLAASFGSIPIHFRERLIARAEDLARLQA